MSEVAILDLLLPTSDIIHISPVLETYRTWAFCKTLSSASRWDSHQTLLLYPAQDLTTTSSTVQTCRTYQTRIATQRILNDNHIRLSTPGVSNGFTAGDNCNLWTLYNNRLSSPSNGQSYPPIRIIGRFFIFSSSPIPACFSFLRFTALPIISRSPRSHSLTSPP